MQPYLILKKAGFEILFTGIITEKVMDSIKQDKLIGSFVTLEDASREVGKILNAYKNDDIDLTVLLTHIGFNSDIQLANLLKSEWGVDIIIGGHSHTIMDQPVKKNNILIAQAGVGSDQIGRFDIIVDDNTNSIIDYSWQLIPINESLAKPDVKLQEYIKSFQDTINRKYNTIVCKFAQKLTHPKREVETSLGNLIADAFADVAESEIVLIGSGSIRIKEMGPLVTLRDLLSCFPFDDVLRRSTINGKNVKKIFSHIMRLENRNSEGECYQVNGNVQATYNENQHKLISLTVNGKKVSDHELYTICLQGYHANNSEANLNISQKELFEPSNSKLISTSAKEVLEEYLRNHQNIKRNVEGRLVYITKI